MKMNISIDKLQGKIISKSSIRLLLSICLIIVFAGACLIFVINWRMKIYALEEAREKALIMLDRNLAIHTYFSHQLKPTLFKKMAPLVENNYFEPVWMSSTYAVRGIDRYYRSISKTDYYYKESAINARSPENEADEFERAFIEKLNKTPGLNELAAERVINAKPYFVVLRRGETMEQNCLRCHSKPEVAPADLLALYGTDRSFNRSVGEVVSAISIRIPLDSAYAKVNRLVLHLSVLLGLTLLIVSGFAAYLSKKWVFDPLKSIRLKAKKISKDPELLGKQIALSSSYELSELTKAFNAMSIQLQRERDQLEYRVEERTKDLKQTRDMLQAVLDAAPAGVVVADNTGRVLLTSAFTQRIFGGPVAGDAKRLAGDYGVFKIDGSPIPHDRLPLSRALAGRTVAETELLVTRTDGTQAIILASATPLRTDEEEIWGAVTVFQDITLLKESKEELQRLSQFPEENPNPVLRCTPDGETLYANAPARHWLATFGRQAEGALPAPLRAAVIEARGKNHAIESEITNPAGRTFSFFAVQPPGEDYINLYAIDFTERKLAETERQKFVSLADQSTEFIGMCDMNFMLFYVNEAGRRLVGLDTLEQACAMPIREFFFPEDQPFIYEKFFPCVLREGRAEVEIRFRHFKTGEPLWMIYNVFHILDAEGKPAGLATVSRNITKRKLAEEALRQSEERLKRSQEIAHLGSWELDLVNNELSWSDEAYRIFGLQPQQFGATYETFLAAVHPDDRQSVDDAYSGSLRDKRNTYEVEHRVIRPDGGIRFVHEKCDHHRDSSGRIIRSIGMVHDITEQKRAQEALERSNQELEQFAYVASHDLQEPLRAIVGFLQLLQSRYGDQIDEKGRNFIERSVKAGHRMQTLIRELLTLSRVHTKGAEFATMDLNQVVKDVLDNLQSIIQDKNAVITCADLPNLTIDASQIQRLFQNLMMNALRYNVSPKPSINIGCQEHDHAYNFYVKDNGIGISSQYYERIFKVFQRLHTDREYPGTGLGLALCKKIVERHGGTIWVESQPQEGSTFFFSLPKLR